MGLIICLIIWLGFGFLCEYMGKQKGQRGCFLYGFLLGIFGVIIVACLKDKSGEVETANNTANKYDSLEKLAQLKESGAITEIEYEVEKAKILK